MEQPCPRPCHFLANTPVCYSVPLYANPPGLTVFTSAPLTSTHRQFGVYFYFERLLLEGLQCYRQHLSTRYSEAAGVKTQCVRGSFLTEAALFRTVSIYLGLNVCVTQLSRCRSAARWRRDAIYCWRRGTARCRLHVLSEISPLGVMVS